jgi:hypothetical protein
MSEAGSARRSRRSGADRTPAPVGVPSLIAWHRTRLVVGFVALICFVGFVLYLLFGNSRDTAWVLLASAPSSAG